ncbi:MAG TPA: PAS domain S-box protein, partial [Anaerolineales bacterium]|nr:PAS domain S-box protein [Anaerolineales bacterium]
ARQQEALYQLAERLNHSGSLQDVYDPALDAILNALQCDRASILLYDEADVMRFVAWRGLSDAYRQATDGHSPWKPDAVDPQPISMQDIDTAELDEALRSVIRTEGIGALAFIPLVSNGKLIGKFMVYFNTPHAFEEDELDFGLTIARQLASTIERKRAEEAMAADLANMQILRDLGARLVPEGDLQVVYREFVQAAVSITHADAGTVQILDEGSHELILLATQGLDQGMIEHFHRVRSGSATSCGIALARRERAFVDYDDPAVDDPDGSLRKHVEAGLFSAQSTPLISRSGVPIGMISTHWRKHHRPTEQELRYIDLLARQATDLIERKQAEEALRASEQRFARFMQHLPGLAWIKNMEGRYVYANAAAEKAFGVSGQDLYGKRDEDIFPPYIASEFKKNDELALLDEKGIQVVETLEQENKVLHYSLVSKFPVPGPDGRPALIGGTALDITERIHMEEALQSAREHAEQTADRIKRLQKVTASLSDVLTPLQVMQVIVDQGAPSLAAETSTILLLTDDGQKLEIVYSSAKKQLVQPYQSFPISLQVPAADAVRSGQPVWIESRQQYLERYPHMAEQIERWGLEAALAIPMKHKGRTLGVLTLSFDHVLPHSEEDQDYILTLARQAAQSLGRARAEEALRDSEERYRAIISQATAGIVRKDASGRLVFVNQAFCNMLGMTAGELIGRTMWDLTHEEDQEENKRLYNRLMEEGTPFQLEKRLLRMDGSTLWVNVSVSPVMGESGKPHSAVSVYADITRRKHAENRLMLLARVSELTRQYEEPDELLYAVTREVGDYFQVRRALFNEIDVENDREVVHRDYCRDAESVAGVHRISDYSSATSVEMMIGKTIVNDDSKIDPRTAQEYERSYLPYGERAYVAVPLMDEDRWVASLWISDDKPRQWDKDDVYLLEAIAERTWTAAEKMRVDRALRDSEERLRVTFNTTAVGFALLTPETRFEDVNDALCQIVGYTREELLSMTLDTLIHPDFIRSTQEHISRLLDGEASSFTIEKLYIRGDGAEVWVQNSISLVRDPNENPLHLIAICQDITERKREEEALRARTEEIETLMNVSPIGIFVANDPECRFISANPAGYRLLEMPDLSQLNISKSAPITEQPGYRVFRDGIEVAAEDMPMQAAARHGIELKEDALELRFENGTRKYIYAFAKPLFDAKGRSRGAIAAMLDISERKRTEEELHQLNLQLEERVLNRTAELQAAYEFLRESEATSRLILESMPDAIVITDREGRIVHANTQVETLFGYTPNEVLGKSVEMLIPERFRNRHLKNRDMYSGQRTRRIMGLGFDLFGQRKDESEFPVDVMLSPIDNNTSWDVMVSIRDNTKQREAQEALRVNEEKLRTLFEILPVGISFLGKEGRIVDMNPALTEILGMSKEDLLQGAFKARRYIRSDGMPMSPKEFASRRAIAENKTIYNVETGIVQPNGEIKWTSVNAAPVQVADVEVVVVTIDITDRKQSEEAIHRHRESLKLLSRRLVEVQEDERHAIARELHDRVGQNLAALTLNLNILRSQLTKETLEKVGTRLNDSVTLVKDVLAITRSVMADLRPNVLDDYGLDAALNEYADRYSQRFGIQVVNSMPATPTPRLDPGIEMTLLRIAQEALTNIARHAQASQASMTLAIDDDAAHLVIEDNGIGILSWQKVNQPGSHGIRIMRERAEAFGGDLKVHSAYKNGTKIEVKIPFGGSASRNKTTQEKRS